MSSFIVSARKYRPNRFDEIVGQKHVSKTLKNALKTDHLGHSFLFCGPRGVGKTTSARILAKVLNCEKRTEDFEPCNSCPSCTAFNEQHSFNIYELDAASNNSVESMRDLVDQVRFPPQHGQYKVYIIDEVHMLTSAAFNAFLKTLEEPPSYAIFILATTEKHKIIPTILSRCQIFDFNRVQVPDIMEHLEMICSNEGISAEEAALHVIAQKADGALRDALSIFDRIVSFSGNNLTYESVTESLNILDYDTFFSLTDALLLQDKNAVLLQFDDILNRGFDGDQVILGLAEHFRNLLVAKNADTVQLLEVANDVKQRYLNQAEFAKLSFLLNGLNIANHCDVGYRQAKNKRLHVELALLRMCFLNQLSQDVPLPTVETEVVKKKSKSFEQSKSENEPAARLEDKTSVDKEKKRAKSVKPIDSIKKEPLQSNPVEEKTGIVPNSNNAAENEPEANATEPSPKQINSPTEGKQNQKQAIAKVNKTIKTALTFDLSTLENQTKHIPPSEAITSDGPQVEENESLSKEELAQIKPEKLIEAWYQLDKLFPSSPSLQNIISEAKVSFDDDSGTLQIRVVGQIALQMLQQQHSKIVAGIKAYTGLSKFLYAIEAEAQENQMIKTFTKEEEMAYIIAQNPAFARLAKELNLQIDYDS